MNVRARDWHLARAQAYRLLGKEYREEEHPRGDGGRWTDAGGGDGGDDHPGEGYSKNARLIDGVIHTTDVYDAVRALYENRKVELDQPRSLSILLDKLGEVSKDMIAKGEKAPNFNLCNVTVKATSLFCADAKGIPRVQMPQLNKDQDEPFRQHLEAKGYKIERQEQYASYLRATQNELNGSKVAGIAALLRSDEYRGNPNPIFVSKDDYILDGHHRWAAEIGNDAADNILANSKKMAIWRVNISITKLLEEAEAFTEGKGKLAIDTDRRKQWLLARERAHALLGRAYNEADHPRDEHGRWTDGGSSSSDGAPARYDTAKVEAKTRQNVAAASAQALKGGTTPLAGSKAEHPATIASREVTATDKQALAPKGVYGQPDVASMKLDPKRYDKDIDKFRDANFYPNFKPSDLSGSTDQAVSNIVAQMKDNLKFLYQYADKSTEIWYDGARALVDDRAKLWGFNDASIAGVYAALSPTKDWDQNVHIADMLLETYKNQQGTKWSAAMDAKSKTLWSAKNQKVVDLVRGKTLGELTDPAQKALWIRTYDETHNKTDYRTVLPNGALGKVVTNADGTPSKVVWQSLPSITNAVKALEANGDRDKISEAMGTAHKVRSFYNNILDPHSGNGDVTIDTHAVGAALLRQLSSGSVPVAHNFGNTPMKVDQPEGWAAVGSSVKTGLSGLYPVYAQAYREAAQELGIQPRQLQSAVWVVKRDTFGEASKKTQEAIEAAWHEYHDNPTTTLKQTRDTIAGLLGLGKHERSHRDDEGGGRPVDARELHRAGMGSAAATVDSRAGDGAAGRAARLELVRRKERRAGSEVVERGGGLGTSAHTDWMNECVPQMMDYGKDQITAVAACLNMWRDAWEDSHPDGANDPGPSPKEADPDSPLAADAKAFNEAEHPRDDHGRWTDSGGGDATVADAIVVSAPATASGHSIQGLPDDIVVKDHQIAQAQERGVWDISAAKIPPTGHQSGRDRYELTFDPKLPSDGKTLILTFKPKPDDPDRKDYYNPVLGELYVKDEGVQYLERTYARPKAGLSRDIEPLPDKDVIYRGMRAEEFQKFLDTGKIESTGSYNMEGQEGLTYWATDAATAQSYANGFAPWPHKPTFERPAYVVATRMPKPDDIRKVEGTGDNEVGVSRAITKDEIVGVWRGDVFALTPARQDIRPSSYDPKESVYESGSGTGGTSDVVWRRADHQGRTDEENKKESDKQVAVAMDKALIRPLAEKVATKLDFNPELIQYSDEDKEFKLGDATYKYGGSYTFGEPSITLYKQHINSDSVKGITAHEIGHRKFELLQNAYKAESKLVMADPGPPPDPNHRYWWGKKGGKDAVMLFDGTLREPYDKKYPIYHEWQQIQNMRPSLEQDDGITPYSKAYWSEWEKGKLNTNIAYHETMAEMSRNFGVMGKHSAVTGKGWRRLYDLQEKVWAATDKATRDAKTTGAVKAIFILNGVRWDVR